MKKNKNVSLPVSEDVEINRLINQAICWEPEAEALFDTVKIQPGWRCIDLGCGPIGILGLLSQRVGSTGLVFGLDSNPVYLQAANDFIIQNHLLNTKVFLGNLYKPGLNSASFNLTHARFVLTQTGCDHLLLKRMIELTQPGGVVILQESDWTTWNCYPRNSAWQKIRNALILLYEHNGGDINAGQRTYKMFAETDLTDVQIRTTIKALTIGHQYRSGMNQMAISLRDKIIDAKILTDHEFEDALVECNAVINDPETVIFSYLLSQVWGYVKK